MDEEKLVEAVRTFDCLWKVSAKVYRDARAKENAWKAVARTDRTHTLLNPFLLFCLLRNSSSSSSSCSSSSVPSSCSSSPVPFAITERVGKGGASREYRLLWIDVRPAVPQGRCIVNSVTLASALRNATLGHHAGSSVVL